MRGMGSEKESIQDDEIMTTMFEKSGKDNAGVFDLIKQYLVEKKKKNKRALWVEAISMMSYSFPLCFYGWIKLSMILWSDISIPLLLKLIFTVGTVPLLLVASFVTAFPPVLMNAPQPDNLVRKFLCKIIPGFKRKEESYQNLQKRIYSHINSQSFQYEYLAHLQVQMKNVTQCQKKWQKDELLNQKELAKSKEVIEHLKNNHDRLITLIMEEDNNEDSIIHAIKHIEDYLKENALGLEENQKIKERKNFLDGYSQFLNENNVVDVIKTPQSVSSIWVESNEHQINNSLKNHL
jgi:hypothetical protein